MTISRTNLELANSGNYKHHAVDISLACSDEPGRREIERFIKLVFHHAYRARIKHFLPYLLAMRQNGEMLAALGIRPAREGELFLETYLDQPIENVLAATFKSPIDRDRIVEIGNLSSTHGGGARALIVTLTAYLSGAGYEWAVFTATPKVRNNFAKLGIDLVPLADADKQRLGNAQHDWGSYYDQKPLVVVGRVVDGVEKIRAAMIADQLFPTAQQLWEDARSAGRRGKLWQPPRGLSTAWPEWALEDEFDFSV